MFLEFHFDFPANSFFVCVFFVVVLVVVVVVVVVVVFFERVDYICTENSLFCMWFPEKGNSLI